MHFCVLFAFASWWPSCCTSLSSWYCLISLSYLNWAGLVYRTCLYPSPVKILSHHLSISLKHAELSFLWTRSCVMSTLLLGARNGCKTCLFILFSGEGQHNTRQEDYWYGQEKTTQNQHTQYARCPTCLAYVSFCAVCSFWGVSVVVF